MTEPKPLDIEAGRSWLMFTWGAVISALRGEPDLCDAFWRLIPFVSALMAVGERHPEETREVWLKRLGEPMPFGGAPLGVENALPKPLNEWTRPRNVASPVPAAEHQGGERLELAKAALRSSLEHTDIASHQRYHGAEPAVRYVEPHREAFIALYEAAQWVAEAREGGGDTIHAAWRSLQGALDKAAPAYGQALVARAEASAPAWSRRRDAPAPGVGYCSCKASADCAVHGAIAKETGGQ